MSAFDRCDEALELGVVETVDSGDPGFMSFGVVLPIDDDDDLFSLLTCVGVCDKFSVELCALLEPETFCWARRSCLRNLARRFWNQT